MVSHWSLSDSKSLQISRTPLSIMADLNNAVVLMVSIRPLISKFSTPCTNPLVPVPSAPFIIGISVTFMFTSFIQFSNKVLALIALFNRKGKVHYSAGFLFCLFLLTLSLGLVVWPRLGDPFESQNPKEFCPSHFLRQVLRCAHTICSYGKI